MASDFRYGLSDAAFDGEVRDLGLLNEPNFELLSLLRPDLIVSARPVQDKAALENIARVLELNLYTGQSDAYVALIHALRLFAQTLKSERLADAVVWRADRILDVCRQRLPAIQPLPRCYIVDLGFGGGKVWIFGARSLPHAVATRLGVKNAWNGQDRIWGWSDVGLDVLSRDKDAVIVWLQRYASSGTTMIERRLMETRLWKNIPAVKAGRVIGLPPTDFFGGLQTATRFALLLTDALLKHARG